MKFEKLIATPYPPHEVIIHWEVDNPCISGAYKFDVEYGGSPAGPWTKDGTVYDVTQYKFNYVPLLHTEVRKAIYFRITCTPPKLNELRGWEPFSDIIAMYHGLSNRDFLQAKEIARKELLRLRVQVGVPVLIYKRKTFGEKCTSCVDTLTNTIIDSKCEECFSTRYKGGYFDPIETFAEIVESPVDKQISNMDVTEDKFARLRIPMELYLNKQDVIIDVNNNQRWAVAAEPTFSFHRTFPLTQETTIYALAPNSVEYKL